MTFKYNVSGKNRKLLVATMGEILEIRPKYLGMPTCAFEVGGYTISKTGEVSFDDRTDSNEVEVLVEALIYGYHADDAPQIDVQEARLSLYTKANYIATKNSIVSALLAADFTITERRYIEYEPDTGYHHYNIDVEKQYEME